jgi:pimeloyl-ACP methyl ester carboxylesterase
MFLEIITEQPKTKSSATPLLFIHGACHGAWCWENFLPYFAERGYEAHAMSLRGHGASGGRERVRSVRAAEYVEDVERAVGRLSASPVLIGHSMGGYIVQKYLEHYQAPAVILLASVPVNGFFKLLIRIALRHPWQAAKLNMMRNISVLFETPELARKALFSAEIPDETLLRHFTRLQDESYCAAFEATFISLPQPEKVKAVPMLVLGAANDALFTRDEVEATARAYRTEAEIFPDMSHDMMLDTGWQNVAGRMIQWLRERGL